MAIRWRDRYLSILYKYRPLESDKPGEINQNTLRIIQHGEIFLSKPSSFNDPFDCRPRVSADASIAQIERYFSSKRVRRDIIEQNLNLIRTGAKRREDYIPQNLKETSDVNRLYCLSRESNNILLWSHYGKNHTGVCIGIRIDHRLRSLCIAAQLGFIARLGPRLTGEYLPAIPVKYHRRMPKPYNIFTGNFNDLKPFMLTKSRIWKYEKEYRIVVPDSKVVTNPIRLQAHQIQDVIFGYNCSKTVQDQLIRVMQTSPYVAPSVKIMKCDLAENSYELRLVSI